MKTNERDLEFYVNAANWPSDLEAAKDLARESISKWKFQDKAPKFLREVDKARTVGRLQEIAIYPLLSGAGLGVIK